MEKNGYILSIKKVDPHSVALVIGMLYGIFSFILSVYYAALGIMAGNIVSLFFLLFPFVVFGLSWLVIFLVFSFVNLILNSHPISLLCGAKEVEIDMKSNDQRGFWEKELYNPKN